MKRLIFTALMLIGVSTLCAQGKSGDIKFELGKGLNVSFNNGENTLYLGGYVQSNMLYEHISGVVPNNNRVRFGVERAYLAFAGNFLSDKLSFFMQLNFVDSSPLLDAWAAYKPSKYLKISVGQKQSFTGTRSMMFYDYALALGDRSVSDDTFFASGREFGVFLESRIPIASMGADLGVAVTSGQGRNAFGTTSSFANTNYGGPKYGARATIYPLGFFAKDNELTGTDFARESCPKLAIGGAYSYNDGTSSANGEGYGDFVLYNEAGRFLFPGYQRISADILLKYRGMTLLAEYTNASAKALDKIYVEPSPVGKLRPRQIANYLTLGDGYNFQAGYLTTGNWAIDARYSFVQPEWSDNQTKITKTERYSLGVAKYFIDNRLKIQVQGSYLNRPSVAQNNRHIFAELNAHIVF